MFEGVFKGVSERMSDNVSESVSNGILKDISKGNAVIVQPVAMEFTWARSFVKSDPHTGTPQLSRSRARAHGHQSNLRVNIHAKLHLSLIDLIALL